MQRLTINGQTANIEVSASEKSLASMDENGNGSDYILLKTKKPLMKSEKQELVADGLQNLEFVGADTYLCHFKPDDISSLQAKPYVVGVSLYTPNFKVSRALRHSIDVVAAGEDELREVSIRLHSAGVEDVSHTINQVATIAEIPASSISVDEPANMLRMRMSTESSKLDGLSRVDTIKVIDASAPKILHNDFARLILGYSSIQSGSQDLPFQFQGEGQTIAIADTGLDKGNLEDMHPAFEGRVKQLIPITRAQTRRTDDLHGHGTHVCGSAVGATASVQTLFSNVQGTAPKASLVLQSLDGSSGFRAPEGSALIQLFLDPYKRHDAHIHSNSWGDQWRQEQHAYNDEDRAVDQCVHDNPDLLILMAAGNTGDQTDKATVEGFAACKNVLTIGATDSLRPSVHGKYISTKLSQNDPTKVAWYSARGPTFDERIKPDVLAPGTAICSTRSRAVPQLPIHGIDPSTDPLYCYAYGTSMATPLVAGCAAVLREFLVKTGTENPPAALLKALLINGAFAFHHAHNGKEGFDIVNIANSLLPKETADGGFRIGTPFEDVGGEQAVNINIPSPASRSTVVKTTDNFSTLRISPPARSGVTLKATMVYTDAPGAKLQNNLNLLVAASDDVIRYGNRGSSRLSDDNNNVEQVIWKGITAGPAVITVKCKALTSDKQDYALVWRIIPNED